MVYGVLVHDASSPTLKLPFTTSYPATWKSLITRTLPFNQPLKDPPIWPSPRTMSRTPRKHHPRTRSDKRSSVETRLPNVAIRTLFLINILEPSMFRSWRCFWAKFDRWGFKRYVNRQDYIDRLYFLLEELFYENFPISFFFFFFFFLISRSFRNDYLLVLNKSFIIYTFWRDWNIIYGTQLILGGLKFQQDRSFQNLT